MLNANMNCGIMISMTTKETRHKYYLNNKLKIYRWNNNYRSKPDVRDRYLKDAKRRHRLNPINSIYRNAKYRAIKKGIEFCIEVDDIHIPEFCPYLGMKLVPGSFKERKAGASPTLDRIDNDLGYTPDNIEVISDLANRMKQNATREQLVVFAKNILVRYSQIR